MATTLPTRSLELDPGHPATNGQLGLRVDVDGERLVGLEVRVGFGHRGFEKQCEGLSWHQILPFVERLQAQSGILSATAYCLGVEKIMGLELPPRSDWLRVLGSELARGADHFARIGRLATLLGAGGPAAWAMRARELIWDCLEALTGTRRLHHYVRIGGVANAMPENFGLTTRRRVEEILSLWSDIDAVLTRNRSFANRLRGVGVLSAGECLALGVTGPILRSAGATDDIRRSDPYLAYEELAFDVAVGSAGDSYDRYLVCMEEIRQSLGMVGQCVGRLEALGAGPVRVRDAWLDRERSDTPAQSEALEAATVYAEGPVVPVGESWTAVESANGEFAFYLVSDGGAMPTRVHCRAPSFFNAQALSTLLSGGELSDIAVVLALTHIGGMECDR